MNKKVLSLLVAFVLLFSGINSALAMSDEVHMVNTKPSVSVEDERIEKIVRMGTKLENTGSKVFLTNGKEVSVEIYSTKAMPILYSGVDISKAQNEMNLENTYVQEFVAHIPMNTFGYTGNHSGDSYGAGLKAWARIYYNHSGSKYLITAVEGNWRVVNEYENPPLSIGNTRLRVACYSIPDYHQNYEISVPVPFYHTTNFSNYADTSDFVHAVGANTWADAYNMFGVQGQVYLHLPISISNIEF